MIKLQPPPTTIEIKRTKSYFFIDFVFDKGWSYLFFVGKETFTNAQVMI